uniref:Uncharacterized protein n=1 Tax=Anguilla anguilla TaxID=7936 RepID=A0A0E9W7D2_ANGAN
MIMNIKQEIRWFYSKYVHPYLFFLSFSFFRMLTFTVNTVFFPNCLILTFSVVSGVDSVVCIRTKPSSFL